MKKRLRKKKRLGEFKRHGFILVSRYPELPSDELEQLLDGVCSFAESRCLGVTGSIEHLYVSRLCITGSCRQCNLRYGKKRNKGDISDADRDALVSFVKDHGATAVNAGPLFDSNSSSDELYEKSTPNLE